MLAIAAVAIFLVITWFFAQYSQALLWDCAVEDDGVSLRLFRTWTVWSIPFVSMKSVRRVSPFRWLRWAGYGHVLLMNRLFATYVEIERWKGRPVLLTPANGPQFLADVERGIQGTARDPA